MRELTQYEIFNISKAGQLVHGNDKGKKKNFTSRR